MHRRAFRFVLLALLLVGTLVTGLYFRSIERRADDLLVAAADVDARVTRVGDLLSGIGGAQQRYVAPGQRNEPWFERMSGLVGQLYDEIAALRPLLRSPTALDTMQALTDEAEALIGADARARENLRLGQTLMAADVIFSDSHNILDMMIGRVRDLRAGERAAHDIQRAALARERWTVLAAAALLWLVGVLALIPTPQAVTGASAAGRSAETGVAEAVPAKSLTIRQATVDLTAAASLCTALSRVTATAALPELLSRAAAILDASGLILWMGAGEELFAVTSHGYQPQVMARLGPIARNADNATAAAWRTGEMTTVRGDTAGNGAVVAPMFGPDACIGVLAVEVRHGREHDPATRAVAAMVAAQLATVVPAWPAASPVKLRSAGM